ncbi:rho guanine nucleotide exchange factor 39 isoform X1 [Lepus europaeus]|uniref:rho guanine nucleotide exchange factor 39 isoform X1 n=1 Tax=Lepus europaeus TaxID=9983 RepID=UPI002B45BFAA|nr:rho guanine nucleotide exchange factor 39 isoform X1 [Lepus europaeus]
METPGASARCPLQEQRARWERKRACTARELLETERRYQEQLGLVATYFLGILRAKGTLRPPERQALFGPWELIHGASQELLPYLEGGQWGQGLEGFCPHLELYTQFAANAERSRATLQEQLKKNRRFRRFVRLQEGRPEFGGLQLPDLLSLPLQRLQQYENLVVALAENTGPNSPDHQQLTRAARLVSETAQRVHSIGQRQKNDQHLRRVQALLGGRQAKGLTSGRWFLRQGWLLVVPPRGEPRARMFFLFSDALLMAKPRPALHLLHSGTFACRALYPMAQCRLCRVFGHSGGPCGGLLSLSFPHEKLLLMSTDQEELSRWYHSLTLAISSFSPQQPEELEGSYKFRNLGLFRPAQSQRYDVIFSAEQGFFVV